MMQRIQKSGHHPPLNERAPLEAEVKMHLVSSIRQTDPKDHKMDKICMERGQIVDICGKTLNLKSKFGDCEKSEVSMLN